jgi:hypothetical protein
LTGLCEIAEYCIDHIENLGSENAYQHAKDQFECMKLAAEGVLKVEIDVDEGFREFEFANMKACHFPEV